MVSAVAVLCLVAGLLEGAFSLSCYHCTTNGSDCMKDEKTCVKTTDICISTITEIITQGKPSTKSLVRACGSKDECNTTYSVATNTTNLYAATKCCDKEKCPIPVFDVLKNTKQNELECPSCDEANEKCKKPLKVKCTGEEKQCVSYNSKDPKTKETYLTQGCATENVCKMQNMSTLLNDRILINKFECTNHAPSLLPGLFFPLAIVIAMLKLLS
ncbi:phospholipase A2 inhibitor and Ly6/PLAUR domain-containing protein-like [Eleutherodactylus coqui]|uniref:UPAR/Ly6 domain-containing protein n=1 Tax=Eleutherodactylus coqui TaxID=57060 RepID=A0A8J6EK76_ELECQ|nr:hypothetical protein GDO78_016668 [Eleutherodactylus coqui]